MSGCEPLVVIIFVLLFLVFLLFIGFTNLYWEVRSLTRIIERLQSNVEKFDIRINNRLDKL